MVESTSLLMRQGRNPLVGSNPTVSARSFGKENEQETTLIMEKFGPDFESKEKLRDATLVFLIRKSQEKSEICLAMKKRGFGVNRWNGVGGKVEKDESIGSAAVREAQEEIGVKIKHIDKCAELSFYFPHNPAWNQKVHVYFSEIWDGEPSESDEMKPQWFTNQEIPFDTMWPDDEFWIPEVLSGKLVRASFIFGEGDVIQKKEIQIVEDF